METVARKHFRTVKYSGAARLGRFEATAPVKTPTLLVTWFPGVRGLLGTENPGDPPVLTEGGTTGANYLGTVPELLPRAVHGDSATTSRSGDFVYFSSPVEEKKWLEGRDEIGGQVHLLHARPVPFVAVTPESYRESLRALRAAVGEIHSEFQLGGSPGTVPWFPFPVAEYPEFWEAHLEYYGSHLDEFGGIQLVGARTGQLPFRKLLALFESIRARCRANTPLLLSGPVYPHEYPTFTYLGVDIFDSTGVLAGTDRGLYLTPAGVIPAGGLPFLPCSCPICLEKKVKQRGGERHAFSRAELLAHNFHVALRKLDRVRLEVDRGTFRSFLEAEAHWDPQFSALLRWADAHNQSSFQPLFPRAGARRVLAIGPESYHRPDFEYYRGRVLETFSPPPHAALLLLLPCSAKKPYSHSNSHRRFEGVVKRRLRSSRSLVQELVLTSPLGCVPRQLENIYPANAYDIPVTGEWDPEEVEITGWMLARLLGKIPPGVPVLAHLDGGYRQAAELSSTLSGRDIQFTGCEGPESSSDNLQLLGEALSEVNLDAPDRVPPNAPGTLLSRFTTVVDYQFGAGAGRALLGNGAKFQLRGRKRWIEERLPKGKPRRLATIVDGSDFIVPSLAGASRLVGHTRLTVKFDGDSLSGSTLFVQGILEANPEIHVGDHVLILAGSGVQVIGVGRAVVPGYQMARGGEGPAVKIMSKVKAGGSGGRK
ncbi:MAG: DUF5591 domain-containing protein [Promethearchaeota archaeon]